MMNKKGIGYALSREKRALDLVFARALVPASWVAKLLIANRLPAGMETIFEQERVGQNGEAATIRKFVTIDPSTGDPFDDWSEKLRKFGGDELAQIKSILDDKAAAVGRRPLVRSAREDRPHDTSYEQFMDALTPHQQMLYIRDVMPTKWGIVNTFGIEDHLMKKRPDTDNHQKRFENDRKDIMDGSIRYDVALMRRFAALSIARLSGAPVPLAPALQSSRENVIPLQRQHELVVVSESLEATQA